MKNRLAEFIFLLLYRRVVPQARSSLNDQLPSVQTIGSPAGIRLKSSEPLHTIMNPTSCLFRSRFVWAQTFIFSAEPCSNNAGKSTIVLWITARIEYLYLKNSNIPQSKPKQCTFNKFVYFNEFPAYFENPNSADCVADGYICLPASKRSHFLRIRCEELSLTGNHCVHRRHILPGQVCRVDSLPRLLVPVLGSCRISQLDGVLLSLDLGNLFSPEYDLVTEIIVQYLVIAMDPAPDPSLFSFSQGVEQTV